MKFSNWAEYKGDLKALTRKIYDAFGPDRMVWGMLGNTIADYRKQAERFDELLAFASKADRAKIRGGNAQRLFSHDPTGRSSHIPNRLNWEYSVSFEG